MSRLAVVTFGANIAAAAAIGATTPLVPRANVAGGQFVVQNGQVSVKDTCLVRAVRASCNMDALVRLATAQGLEDWRAALEAIEFVCFAGGRRLLDSVPFGVLANGPISTLGTTAMDVWTSGFYPLDGSFALAPNNSISANAVVQAVTPVAIQAVQLSLICDVQGGA